MKHLKIILALTFLVLLTFALVYSNLVEPGEQSPLLGQLSKIIFPLFLLFSFLMMFLKKREDKKKEGKTKLTNEDKELFKSVDDQSKH